MDLNYRKIKAILDELQVENVAFESGFQIRKPKKLSANELMTSFFKMVISGNFSYRLWASHLANQIGDTVSFQAISKKLDQDNTDFFERVLLKAMSYQANDRLGIQTNDLFAPFHRVLIEDSTCFKLPKSLAEHFPGPKLPHGRKAMGRVQARFQLKSNTLESISITDFCKNDRTYANNVVGNLQTGDLVIRDLGYWRIKTLREIKSAGAYFLSRIPTSINVYQSNDCEKLDLVKFLKQKASKGCKQVDLDLRIGRKEKMPIRFIALKLTKEQAKRRMEMTKANRHKKCKMSEQAKYLSKWNLFVTNIDRQTWSPKCIYAAYNLRWHIEMMFKCWKSNFRFEQFFKHCKKQNPVKPRIIVMLLLVWLALFYQRLYNTYASKVWENSKELLSPMKFGGFLKEHFRFIEQGSEEYILQRLTYYCTYDKRKDRKNHLEKILF